MTMPTRSVRLVSDELDLDAVLVERWAPPAGRPVDRAFSMNSRRNSRFSSSVIAGHAARAPSIPASRAGAAGRPARRGASSRASSPARAPSTPRRGIPPAPHIPRQLALAARRPRSGRGSARPAGAACSSAASAARNSGLSSSANSPSRDVGARWAPSRCRRTPARPVAAGTAGRAPARRAVHPAPGQRRAANPAHREPARQQVPPTRATGVALEHGRRSPGSRGRRDAGWCGARPAARGRPATCPCRMIGVPVPGPDVIATVNPPPGDRRRA